MSHKSTQLNLTDCTERALGEALSGTPGVWEAQGTVAGLRELPARKTKDQDGTITGRCLHFQGGEWKAGLGGGLTGTTEGQKTGQPIHMGL